MNRFPKPVQTILKNLRKLPAPAAFGNPSMWLLAAFRNSFLTALSAFSKIGSEGLAGSILKQYNSKGLQDKTTLNFRRPNRKYRFNIRKMKCKIR
jgi:hypothetical protein